MEFFGSLVEAEDLGITRDEFLYIWTKEMDVRILCQHVRNLQSLSHTQAPDNQVTENQLTVSLAQQASEIVELKSSLLELKSELCHLRTDLQNQSQQIVETTSASFRDQQESRLQTITSSVETMRSDLDKLRSDMATELQMLSSKLAPIADMKEQIEAALKSFSNNHAKVSPTPLESLDDKMSHTPLQSIGDMLAVKSDRLCEDTADESHAGNPIVTTVKGSLNKMNISKDRRTSSLKSVTKNSPNDNQRCVIKEHVHQNALSESESKTCTFTKGGNMNGDFKSLDNLSTIDSPNQNDPEKQSNPPFDCPTANIPHSSPSSVSSWDSANTSLSVASCNQCFYSRIVRSNAKHVKTTKLRVNDKVEAKDVVDLYNPSESPQVVPQPRIPVMPTEGATFNIPSTHPFYDCNGDFYTDLYYTWGAPCKARLRLRLATDGRLAVTALISLKELQASYKPNVHISGEGYISAISSGGKGYSKLWQFSNSKLSSTQVEGEVTVEASVSLQTNRYIYANITYKRLVAMGYDLNRNLTFHWNLRCS